MPSPLATHLAERFASDARALRARATALAAAPNRGGPSARDCRAMADACDRIERLFADVEDDAAVATLLPTLGGLVAGAPSEPTRHVYAGAVVRVQQALDGPGGDEDDGDAADADDEDAR